ncbi:hypothetical protein E2320_020256, partial [Naja naja]
MDSAKMSTKLVILFDEMIQDVFLHAPWLNKTVRFLFSTDELKLMTDYECVCEGMSCVNGLRCKGHRCFSSLSINNGERVYQKGCFQVYEQGKMTCRTPPSSDQAVECCQGHLCNFNITAELPMKGHPSQGEAMGYTMEMFVIFVLAPVMVLIVFSAAAVLIVRKIRQHHMERLNSRDAEYGTIEGLIASNVGDNTLA